MKTTLATMFEAPATEFPFVAELPKREKSRLVKIWDQLQELSALMEEKGLLVPFPVAASLLEISHQRVQEICESGRLDRIEFRGHRYVTEKSIVEFAKCERKAGRPPGRGIEQAATVRGAWKMARQISKK